MGNPSDAAARLERSADVLDALSSASGAIIKAIVPSGSSTRPLHPAVLIRGSDVLPEAVAWLWGGWLAQGMLHVLAGAPGTGKTTVALDLAARVSRGTRWPDSSACEAGDVLIWSGEDAVNTTLAPRLMAMGADMERVHFIDAARDANGLRPFDPATDLPNLQATIHALGLKPKLLIIDPIVSAVAGDSHKNTETRRGLQPLVDLAKAECCAVLGISHFSKGSSGKDVTERVTGSLAFGALARVVFASAKRPEEEGGGRLFCRAKSNIGPDDGGFVYELENVQVPDHVGIDASRVVWGEVLSGTARELLATAERNEEDNAKTEREEAQDWLRDLLQLSPITSADIKKAAERNGLSWRTVERAATKMGVEKKREGFGAKMTSFWSIPAFPPAHGQSRQQKEVAAMGEVGGNGPVEEGDV